ncbi:hypothetical protein EON68_01695, partial [archaeon]
FPVARAEERGSAMPDASHLRGASRWDAREQLVTLLTQAGLYVGAQSHAMPLALCSRSGDVLEPRAVPQWYVRTEQLAADALRAVEAGEMGLFPRAYHREWRAWLGNNQDWCISRQLWWGHRIPAWRLRRIGPATAAAPTCSAVHDETEEWIVTPDAVSARAAASLRCGGVSLEEAAGGLSSDGAWSLTQDEDVLDTWFSSALFPLSALRQRDEIGGPDFMPRDAAAYPLALMETGSDILFFWVARMVMLCSHLTSGRLPFRDILLHPVIRDKSGRKMSKSLGNVIDPLQVMDGVALSTLLDAAAGAALPPAEIKKSQAALRKDFPDGIPACGSDALRLALVLYMAGHTHRGMGTLHGAVNLDLSRATSARAFGNKLWNAVRFLAMHATALQPAAGDADVHTLVVPGATLGVHAHTRGAVPAADASLLERWLLHQLHATAVAVNDALDGLDVATAAASAQRFLLSDVCDVYVEWCKVTLAAGDADAGAARSALSTLSVALDASLRMLHPFMPFVTEELFQHMHYVMPLGGDVLHSSVPPAATAMQPRALLHTPFPSRASTLPGGELL